jgi:hypothetical protein
VAGFCEYGDEPAGCEAAVLVCYKRGAHILEFYMQSI